MPATTIIHCKHVLFLLNSSNGPTSLVTMKASMEKSKSQERFQTKLLQQTDIHLTFNLKCRTHLGQEKLIGAASITFTQDTIDRISKLWQDPTYELHTFQPPQTMHLFRPAKDALGPKASGIYCIPCDCSQVYMRQTGSSIKVSCKEYA